MPASPLKPTQSPRQATASTTAAAQHVKRNAPRKSSVRPTPQVFASPSQVLMMDPSENTGAHLVDEHTRKQRRVTFSRRQELTDYDREEPTVNIRPASEMPMPDTPSTAAESSTANLTQSSVESESMSMDMSMTGVYQRPGLTPASPRPARDEEDSSDDDHSSVESESMDMSMTDVYQRPGLTAASPRPVRGDEDSIDDDQSSAESQSMEMSMTGVYQPQSSAPASPRMSNTPLSARSSTVNLTPSSAGSDSRSMDMSLTGVYQPENPVSASRSLLVDMDEDNSEDDVEKSVAVLNHNKPEPQLSRAELAQTLRDNAVAEGKNKNMREDWLPRLRALHAQLRAKAQKESARTEAIKTCDPDELAGLHQAIDEQSAFLSDSRQKKKRAAEQFQRVRSRLDDVLDQKHALVDAISTAREVYQSIQGCTRGEAARLLQETTQVQRLHLWTVVRLPAESRKQQQQRNTTRVVELVYDAAVVLQAELVESGLHSARSSIAGGRFHAAGKMPALRNAEVRLCKGGEGAGLIQKFAIDVLNEVVRDLTSTACPATEILRTVSNVWLRQSQLQGEFDLLQARWPTELIRTSSPFSSASLVLRSSMLLKRRRAKIRFQTGCSAGMLLTLEGMGEGARAGLLEGQAGWETDSVRVEGVYGGVDSTAMTAQVVDCLERFAGQVGPSSRLVHACDTLLAIYDV
ncbi:unnamed protein product [Tilletia controversa]|uniref:Knl1 C-terminal RWD domain-containing protein n=1 Tax=Tilletia controversa TaxID=13291 RepID=A0A8X7MZQ1_9BASI|nr:hypothetical protein CF328_g103 [Tilletia controversa]KAE8255811.1 hypothetical protein A4X06_0g236 [Tilletia controversa]CAD6902576.1 unnamed protein product [Tilletia controversa]CAD6921254.1 unnamed protein product [Tilletia controversa]